MSDPGAIRAPSKVHGGDTEKGSDSFQQTAYENENIQGLETSPETALHRGLKARHISMIAIGGALGTGLLVNSGKGLAQSGPGSIFISFTLLGALVFAVLASVGEMAAWFPLSAGFTGYASRYCHPSLGFATGWTYVQTP
ncbi:amino acid permease [Hirsutella rhossiliensis]|uniref:Amino acid permease domain-containing protein n=1 Tax=Hirsutella rhossiliensis TaxID=111463 RepID=A0A9P8SE81_9HYPO|nr:amino acid permease domain-containing protein [Hirsutella rhossiliensis]KAH0959401.1 amino acid permease domain-containing protein [Hirsutella rhossiliensis]